MRFFCQVDPFFGHLFLPLFTDGPDQVAGLPLGGCDALHRAATFGQSAAWHLFARTMTRSRAPFARRPTRSTPTAASLASSENSLTRLDGDQAGMPDDECEARPPCVHQGSTVRNGAWNATDWRHCTLDETCEAASYFVSDALNGLSSIHALPNRQSQRAFHI